MTLDPFLGYDSGSMSSRRKPDSSGRSRSRMAFSRTIPIVLGFAILTSGAAFGEEAPYDLKYKWNPGEVFTTAEVIRAEGTVGEGTAAATARYTARLIRNYEVGSLDPIRFPKFPVPLERRLESADCEISFGTRSLRLYLTPDKMEINGVALWERATGGSATGVLAPLVDARILRISDRGESQWEVSRQTGRFNNPEPGYRNFSMGLETLTSLGGLGIPFVDLPEKKTNVGETWRREMDSPNLPESDDYQTGASWLTQRFEYALTGPVADAPEKIDVHVLATGDAHEMKVMDIRKLVVPAAFLPEQKRPTVPGAEAGLTSPSPSTRTSYPDTTAAPKPEKQQDLVFENYKRQYEGSVRFDPVQGRIVGSRLSGTLEMDILSRVYARAGSSKTPLKVRLNVDLETTFDYPEAR